jgi:hypothetical protein
MNDQYEEQLTVYHADGGYSKKYLKLFVGGLYFQNESNYLF